MNQYMVCFEWSGYNFYSIFKGENENDPNMRKEIIKWIGRLPEGDGDVAQSILEDDRDEAGLRYFSCYQISNEVDLGDILGEAWDQFKKDEEEWDQKKSQQVRENELRQLELLKKKYEGDKNV